MAEKEVDENPGLDFFDDFFLLLLNSSDLLVVGLDFNLALQNDFFDGAVTFDVPGSSFSSGEVGLFAFLMDFFDVSCLRVQRYQTSGLLNFRLREFNHICVRWTRNKVFCDNEFHLQT